MLCITHRCEKEDITMWTRADLKMRGKLAFKRNYWAAVLVAFIMTLFMAASTGSSGSSVVNESSGYGTDSGSMMATVTSLVIAAVAGITGLIILLVKLFVGNALLVGGNRFFILNQTELPSAGTLGYVFKSGNYGNVILTMFLKDLYTFLWTLLLIIPGIIKSYEYLMVPYILAENPGMDRKEAFLISKKMMMGQKWDTFVLDISFIGWRFLEVITFGIMGIFYVQPYYQATISELYTYNRSVAYQNGYIR